MATTRIMPLHTGKGRNTGTAIRDIIGYVANPNKTQQGELVTSFACDPRTADGEFLLSKREYIAQTGRVRGKDDVIAYHLRQAFVPGEITPEEANRLGQELARRFTKGNHAYIVCTHIDRKHVHNHIIWNAVALDCDRKFRNFWGSSKAIRRLSDTICIENGYSIVADPKEHGTGYDKWLGDAKKPSHREQLRMALDQALAQKPADFDQLLSLLKAAGYEIKPGKNPSLRSADQKRFIRLDTLGDGYTKDDLLAVIAGTKAHVPRKAKATPVTEKKINLIIDIQSKLQAGKGAGYARWASVFNLKQMAQSVNYLMEHSLLDYGDLKRKSDAATAEYHALSSQIKEIEKRMADTASLRKHIINYMKTREVYAAYRKAGYSKKFLAEHESDILIHKASKQAFDALGLTKLPTIRSLQDEYAALEAQKKQIYPAYRQAREDMRELLTVKANVDRILDLDDYTASKDKEQGQR